MFIRMINPFVRKAFILLRTPHKKVVKSADCRLFYVLKGSGELTVEETTYNISDNTLALWKSGTEYCWNLSKSKKHKLVIFNFDYTHDYCSKKKPLKLITQGSTDSEKILPSPEFEDATILNKPIILNNMSLFKADVLNILQELEAQRMFSSQLAGSMLYQLILKITEFAYTDAKTHSIIESVIEYIKANYNDNLTNISLGKTFHYHPHYINTLMKEYVGTTIHSYLTNCRMKEALNLLVNTKDSIEEISHSVGYKNPTHFYKVFKDKYGATPLEYRKSSRLI